jgi:3'(2'), 5'-bisphosphate nucleotidase
MPLMPELIAATELARQAGDAILEIAKEARSRPTMKGDGQGPVTAADLAADRIISEGLRARFPDDVVVTEETWKHGAAIEAAPRVWCVDPLDGTEDFVAGRPDYAVQIGLVKDGVPVLGVVYSPEERRLWRGFCWHDDGICERLDENGHIARLNFLGAPVLKGPPRVAVSRAHPSRLVDFVRDELGGVAVPRGSVGLKIGMLLDGQADLYVSASKNIKVWDTAGPAAILSAAGGRMTALDGTPLVYVGSAAHQTGIAAYTPAAEAVRDTVTEAIARARGRMPQPPVD